MVVVHVLTQGFRHGAVALVGVHDGGEDHYKTSFAVFGFRYAQVFTTLEIDPADFTAVAVYSDMEQTGGFTCSDERVNMLMENTRWSMKGNFLDVPTDCPTRERLGWTGDAQIAGLLGHADDAEKYRQTAETAKAVYPQYAELDTDRQAKLVRPLALGLLDGEEKRKAQKRLVQAVEHYRYRVGTGFLSTPFILPVLTEAGEAETAYKMLLNEEKPGWLYEVRDGATTIWESWEGDLSRNHYSPGAACRWLFDTVGGIRVEGENHFVIQPVPGGGLTHAEAAYNSPYGRVESRWEKKAGGVKCTIAIPSNTTAEIRLPNGQIETVNAGTYEYEI